MSVLIRQDGGEGGKGGNSGEGVRYGWRNYVMMYRGSDLCIGGGRV